MQKKKKILILCPFPQGVAAGQRLKYEQYFQHWNENNYIISVSPFMDLKLWNIVYKNGNYIQKIIGTLRGTLIRIFDLLRLKNYDIIYVFLWVTPFGSIFFEKLVRLMSNTVVYDIEDNIYIKQSNNINPVLKYLKGNGKASFLIKTSDHVITSSPDLNNYCLKNNKFKSCTYITSSIDIFRFIPVNKYNNDKVINIGWTGTFSSKIYLDKLKNVFYKLYLRCKFKLIIIGNFDYHLPGIDIEVIQWSEPNEVSDLQKIDIGIYPLNKDDWVMGKSGLKAIQYMAFGIPTVATNIGTTPQIIKNMYNGILVDTEEEWVNALELLINNPKLRSTIGNAARETVINKYSLEVVKDKYINILNNF